MGSVLGGIDWRRDHYASAYAGCAERRAVASAGDVSRRHNSAYRFDANRILARSDQGAVFISVQLTGRGVEWRAPLRDQKAKTC